MINKDVVNLKFISVLGAVVALLISGIVGVQAHSAASFTCGTYGTSNLGIINSGGQYKTMLTNTRNSYSLRADVRWKPPTPEAPLQWYNGTAVVKDIAFSPGVAQSNYPAQMRGYMQGCTYTGPATNY